MISKVTGDSVSELIAASMSRLKTVMRDTILPPIPKDDFSTPPPLPVVPPPFLIHDVEDDAPGRDVKKAKPNSKRHTLSKLPKDWREKIFAASVPSKPPKDGSVPRLASAVAVLWASGCRPAELHEGVRVKRVGDLLQIHIECAKDDEIPYKVTSDEIDPATGKRKVISEGVSDRGMEWRVMTIDPNLNSATRYLLHHYGDGDEHIIKYNRNSIRTRMNELSEKVLRKSVKSEMASPYSFRHALCSDVKSCDSLDDVTRAQIMGHLAVSSLENYGRRRRGGGGVSPVASVKTEKMPRGDIGHAPPSNIKNSKIPKIR